MLIGVLEVFAKLVVLWNHSPNWSGILYGCVSGEQWFHLNIHLLQDVFLIISSRSTRYSMDAAERMRTGHREVRLVTVGCGWRRC